MTTRQLPDRGTIDPAILPGVFNAAVDELLGCDLERRVTHEFAAFLYPVSLADGRIVGRDRCVLKIDVTMPSWAPNSIYRFCSGVPDRAVIGGDSRSFTDTPRSR